MTQATIDVAERAGAGEPVFDVSVSDAAGTSRHTVRFDSWAERKTADLGCSVSAFVAAAFRFLLAREPRESILPDFDLSVIARYFPEVEREIGTYLE